MQSINPLSAVATVLRRSCHRLAADQLLSEIIRLQHESCVEVKISILFDPYGPVCTDVRFKYEMESKCFIAGL